jgi:LemA protein
MAHEKGVLASVTELRAQSINAGSGPEKLVAENQLSSALKSLFAVAEAYPDLKANQNFLDLQKNLAEIEDQIQMARRYYNGVVREFNTLIESFPSSIVAKKGEFTSVEYFEVESATERQTPGVKF